MKSKNSKGARNKERKRKGHCKRKEERGMDEGRNEKEERKKGRKRRQKASDNVLLRQKK